MLKIDFRLPLSEEIELVPLGDVHIGSPQCDEASFKAAVDYILEEPSNPKCARVCLLNGDLTESVTRNSKGDIFDLTMTPSVQVATMINYLLPLTETSEKYPQGKIISYCAGNHDYGRYKDTGISAAESIAVKLGLEDRFSVDGCYTFLTCKRIGDKSNVAFTIYNTHLSGSAGTIGGKANRVLRAGVNGGVLADVIIGSHVHEPLTFKEDIIVPTPYKMSLHQKTVTYVITSAHLRYGGYAQRGGMKPATIAVPKVLFKQGEKNGSRYAYTEVLL